MALYRPASASSTRLTYQQIEALWIRNGGSAADAPIMAAIAMAESGGNTQSHNPRPPDDSYGLWQINYYDGLRAGRTAAYGSPAQLLASPDRQARAAISIRHGQGLSAWSTYTSGAYRRYLNSGATPDSSGLPAPGSTVTGASDTTSSSSSGTCLIKAPVTGTCLLSRSQGRGLLGASLMVAGGVIGMAGLIVLAAYGLQRSGALDTAARATAVLPGAGGAAARLRTSADALRSGQPSPAAERRRAARAQRRQAGRQAARERIERRRGEYRARTRKSEEGEQQ